MVAAVTPATTTHLRAGVETKPRKELGGGSVLAGLYVGPSRGQALCRQTASSSSSSAALLSPLLLLLLLSPLLPPLEDEEEETRPRAARPRIHGVSPLLLSSSCVFARSGA
ncbi:unnamed protein product [Lampetra planeri]